MATGCHIFGNIFKQVANKSLKTSNGHIYATLYFDRIPFLIIIESLYKECIFIFYGKNTDRKIILNDIHGIELNNTDNLTHEQSKSILSQSKPLEKQINRLYWQYYMLLISWLKPTSVGDEILILMESTSEYRSRIRFW